MRIKSYSLIGLTADPNAFATSQAVNDGSDVDALALDQAVDVAADTNGLALAQTYADGVALTLEAGAGSLIPPRNVTLTADSDESGTNFTIVGLDQDGVAAGEVLAGPDGSGGAASTTSVNVYSSITSITPDATEGTDEIEAGWAANSVPYPLKLNGAIGTGAIAPAKPVTIQSGENVSGITFTIVGTAPGGTPQQETITGPNNATVSTANVYASVSSITPSDDSGGGASSVAAGVGPTPSGFQVTLLAPAADIPGNFGVDALEVTITSDDDMTGVTFTVTGLSRWGVPISESIVGADTGVVQTLSAFSEIDSVTANAVGVGNVEIGFPDRVTSPWVICGIIRTKETVHTARVSLLPTEGAFDGIVEVTYSRPGEVDGDAAPIDETITVTPGTPVNAQGTMCRAVATSGDGTAGVARFAQAGR